MDGHRRAGSYPAVATVLTCCVLAATAGPAQAHAALVRSDPADGAQVGQFPAAISLIFSEAVQPRYNELAVTAPDGRPIALGAPQVSGTVVRQPIARLPAVGRYAVAYRLLSADGHVVTGQLSFTYAPMVRTGPPAVGSTTAPPTSSPEASNVPPRISSSPAASPALSAAPAVSDDGRSLRPAIVVPVLLVLAGAAFALARRRRQAS